MRILVVSALGVALIAVGAVGGYLVGKNDKNESRAAVGGLSALPAGWNLCTNAVHGFAIGYPAGWHEEHLTPEQACRYMAPKPFRFQDGGWDATALWVYWSDETAEQYVQYLTAYEDYMCRSRHSEDVVVGRVRAIRFEAMTTLTGTYQCGTRDYGYAVNWRNGAVVVQTVTEPGVAGYSKRKRVVDAAVRTLYFPKPKPKPKPKSGFCDVPRMIGLMLGHAKTLIRNGECTVGRIRRARSRRVGRVIAQSPKPGTTKPAGFPVRLVVGRR
jgi:hypothetical protein